jgi:hypothetical protein
MEPDYDEEITVGVGEGKKFTQLVCHAGAKIYRVVLLVKQNENQSE